MTRIKNLTNNQHVCPDSSPLSRQRRVRWNFVRDFFSSIHFPTSPACCLWIGRVGHGPYVFHKPVGPTDYARDLRLANPYTGGGVCSRKTGVEFNMT